ncbi:unnamed protein product, partial [Didymodactylos carnosus]
TNCAMEYPNSDTTPKQGEIFLARMRNGIVHAAEILESRIVDDAIDQQTIEYFVHYLNYDHRNDEWISIDRLLPEKGAPDKEIFISNEQQQLQQQHSVGNGSLTSYSQKRTRKLKSRRNNNLNDDINDLSLDSFETADLTRKDHKINLYCQNLCLLARLFLEHKVICYNVSDFLFYVLTEFKKNENKERFIGYFSKEKDSTTGFNLSCLLCLPHHQRKGYGKLLIQFSYELTKLEGTIGTPEKPISDLGYKAYLSYWTWSLLTALKDKPEREVNELSSITGINNENVLETLSSYGFVKYWRHGNYICASKRVIEAKLQELSDKRFLSVDPQLIRWSPSIKGKSKKN